MFGTHLVALALAVFVSTGTAMAQWPQPIMPNSPAQNYILTPAPIPGTYLTPDGGTVTQLIGAPVATQPTMPSPASGSSPAGPPVR